MSEQDSALPVIPPGAEQGISVPPEVETASTDPASVSEEQETPEAEKTFTQKELDEIIAKRIAKAERKAQREADRRIADLLREQQAAQMPKEKEEGRPVISQFQTVEEYDAAMEKWADKLAERKLQETIRSTHEAQERAEMSKAQAAFQEREEEARDKYPDFDQKAYGVQYDCSPVMAQAIQFSDIGPDIAYFFGNHPDEAARIARLPPILAVKEMGKLEVKISDTPPATKTTSAPPPISPVKPKSTQAARSTLDPKSLEELGTSEWIRRERLRQAKKWEAEHR